MRFIFLAAALTGMIPSAAAADDAPNARSAYVERRGLLEMDARCRFFSPDIRAALGIGAARTRGALLRAGWTTGQVRDLERAVVDAARGRACNDARTLTTADEARAAFSAWAHARTMEFPGWQRTWIARRASGDGWRLSQAIDSPVIAVFGVRDRDGAQRLTLVVPAQRGQSSPGSATLVMRHAVRTGAPEISLARRVAYGLEAGVAEPAVATSFASTRSIERLDNNGTQTVYAFPDTAFRNLLALDPRESVEIRFQDGRRVQRLFVEVGDIAAARDFLTMP